MSKLISSQIQRLLSVSCVCHYKPVHSSACNGSLWKSHPEVNIRATHYTSQRLYSDRKDISVPKERHESEVSTDVKTRIKEATKTVSYTGVILVGVGVTAVLFYAIVKELFSSKSPSGIYSKTFKKCLEDVRVLNALGEPISGHGEETRRGRRRHVSHVSYEKDGVPHMRMLFYLKGSRNSATVHLDVKENPNGDMEYRYLFIQVEDYNRRVIVLEDNRALEDASKTFKTPLDDFNSPLGLEESP